MPRKEHRSHVELKIMLEKSFTADDLLKFKERAKAEELREGELSRMKTLTAVFVALERKNKISEGNYGKLKEMLRDTELDQYVQDVEDAERAQGIVPLDQVDEGDCEMSPVMETPPVTVLTNPPVRQRSQDQGDAGLCEQMLNARTKNCYVRGKGLVVILNNYTQEREGSPVDESNIKIAFSNTLQYLVLPPLQNANRETILKHLEKIRTKIKDDAGFNIFYTSLFVFVSSHGQKEGIKTGHGNEIITADEIMTPFNGENLSEFIGKPKIFIIQSCRGKMYGRGVSRDQSDDKPGSGGATPMDEGYASLTFKTLPVNADMLLAYATSEGTKAWRNDEEGSWFIKHLCGVIMDDHKEDHLMEILTTVNGLVAERVSTEQDAKQMPQQISTLTKKCYL